MGGKFKLRFGLPFGFIIVFVLSVVGFAFAGNIGFPGSNAGQGLIVIEGYRVENVIYDSQLSEEINEQVAIIVSAEFDIYTDPEVRPVTAETDKVFIQYRGGGERSEWRECQIVAENKARCETEDLAFQFKKITSMAVNAFFKPELDGPSPTT